MIIKFGYTLFVQMSLSRKTFGRQSMSIDQMSIGLISIGHVYAAHTSIGQLLG